jgi:hypothetical protein
MDYKAMDAHSASTALQPKELVKTEYPKGLSIKARRGGAISGRGQAL